MFSDRPAAGQGIAEVVGRHELLIECGEIGGPFRFADIHHHGTVLPDIVMIVGVVAGAMNEAGRRPLIEVDIVNAVSLAVEAAEDADVEFFTMRFR